jgi:hypothetical protein
VALVGDELCCDGSVKLPGAGGNKLLGGRITRVRTHVRSSKSRRTSTRRLGFKWVRDDGFWDEGTLCGRVASVSVVRVKAR